MNATDKITLTGNSTNVTGVGLEGGSVTAGGAVVIDATTTTGKFQGANIGRNVQGASVKITGNSQDHFGVAIGANVTATSGDVFIDGTSINSRGVNVDNGTTVTAHKKLTIEGKSTGASGGQGVSLISGVNNQKYGASLVSTTDEVFIKGTSAGSVGIDLTTPNGAGYPPGVTISAGTHITLEGVGKTGGVRAISDSVMTAGSNTVAGDIKITGTSSAGDGVNFSRYPKAARLDASRDIEIIGTADGVSGAGFTTTTSDLNGQAPMMKAGRDFKLTATNSNVGNTGNVINGQSGLQVTAGRDITLKADKPNPTGNAIYFYSQTNGVGGNASFKSTAGDVLIQSNQGGIIFQNAYTGTPSSPYTSSTDISGRNVTIDNTGGNVTVDSTTGKATLAVGAGGSTTNGINLASTIGRPYYSHGKWGREHQRHHHFGWPSAGRLSFKHFKRRR